MQNKFGLTGVPAVPTIIDLKIRREFPISISGVLSQDSKVQLFTT
jgi:hypothetical protein